MITADPGEALPSDEYRTRTPRLSIRQEAEDASDASEPQMTARLRRCVRSVIVLCVLLLCVDLFSEDVSDASELQVTALLRRSDFGRSVLRTRGSCSASMSSRAAMARMFAQ